MPIMIHPNEHTVVIIGLPGTGKTFLTSELSKQFPDYRVIHCDDYLKFGSNEDFNKLSQDVINYKGKQIIEGSLCYRLLRHGVTDNNFFPDLIIVVLATESERYRRRPDKQYSQMDRIYRSIFRDYWAMSKRREPRLIEINTTDNIPNV